MVTSNADLLITENDLKWIQDHRVMENFYVSYKGTAFNDHKGISDRQDILANNMVYVLKAFFCPPTFVSPNSNDFPKNTNYAKVLDQTINEIDRFRGVSFEKLEESLSALQYSRRFEILTAGFNIDKSLLLKMLFSILYVNCQREKYQPQ